MANVNGAFQLSPFEQTQAVSSPSSYYNVGTITQSGNNVLGNGTAFTADMVGGILVYGSTSGSPVPAFITGYISATQITVSVSQTIDLANPYLIWYGGFAADANGNVSFNNMYNPNGLAITPTTGKYMSLNSVGTFTAHAGGGQGSATLINKQAANVSVVATAADSVVLPIDAQVGAWFDVTNTSANSMNVFPPVGGNINGGTANAAYAHAAAASIRYIHFGSGVYWRF